MKDVELKWTPCNVEDLTKFLVEESGFNADHVKGGIQKLQKAFKYTSKPQLQIDIFFKAKPSTNNEGTKRKAVKEVTNKIDTKKTKIGGRARRGKMICV